LKQDASLRSYFRVVLPEAEEKEEASWVVMVMPKGALKQSEEGGAQAVVEELPFLNVHRYLQGLGLPVPAVFCFDEARGMMLLEDLGDTTLEAHVRQHPGALEASYAELVDMLACLRARAEKAPSPECLGFQRAFNRELYMWELEHFREWGLDIWSTVSRTEADNAALLECFEALAHTLDALPRGLTHRDFQSRNLMLKRGLWHMIDFQDALLAPRAYDLVALLRDSYIELEPDFVQKMIAHYVTCFAKHSGEAMDESVFAHEFELLTVQRKLKDAARFEYIARQKKNTDFLPFIPASLRYARMALSRLPELCRLRDLLARWLPEFA
jgi:aminoglycoside/choline kinase family phosphotransferase